MQTDLFAGSESAAHSPRLEMFDLPNADLCLIHHWLAPERAQELLGCLSTELAWEQTEIRLYGQGVKIPRLNAWYGDAGASYKYSGTRFDPLPWTSSLLALKQAIEAQTGDTYNSVLANLYRDGRDSVAWHSDNEPELGRNPSIASLSLGENRNFLIKHRKDKDLGRISIPLTTGSLLIMRGEMQHHWLHSVPKTTRPVGPRINLTFRRVLEEQ